MSRFIKENAVMKQALRLARDEDHQLRDEDRRQVLSKSPTLDL